MKKAGIYIHIPFCSIKCMYCDFYSVADQNDQIPFFLDALIKEIEYVSKKISEYGIKPIDTVKDAIYQFTKSIKKGSN